jgi:flagellar hook-basal body complex protein FliE
MIDAINALRIPSPAATGPASPTVAAGPTPSAGFADVLAEVSNNAIGRLERGEAVALGGIEGKASVQQVVEAIMSAEQTLQTALAIRDKVVSAYQEISRMSI